MTRIVTSVPRPKRPSKKRKAAAPPTTGRIVRPVKLVNPSDHVDSRSDAPTSYPANDDRKPAIITLGSASDAGEVVTKPKPVIVTSISRKRQKRLRVDPAGTDRGAGSRGAATQRPEQRTMPRSERRRSAR